MVYFCLGALALAYIFYKWIFSPPKNYWGKFGVRQIDTSPAASYLDLMMGRKLTTAADDFAVSQMLPGEKVCGIVTMGTPILIVKDLDMVKRVLIKDFDHFVDRRHVFTKADGTMGYMLTALEGGEWKKVRSAVSPSFSSGRIRKLFDSFNEIATEWIDEYTMKAKSSNESSVTINVVNSSNEYTVEVISSSVFGIKADCITNSGSYFMTMANRHFEMSRFRAIKLFLRVNLPNFARLLGISMIDDVSQKYFEEILDAGLQARRYGENTRNDFLQNLIEVSSKEPGRRVLTEQVMKAQSILFFAAGFSTTSHVIAFTLYALAAFPEIQNKLREEVNRFVSKEEHLAYDDTNKLVYLDMIVCEILRKYPGSNRLERICTKDYEDIENGLRIPKGSLVVIPINTLHNSPDHYSKPEEFCPDNFAPEVKAARSPYAFMPFGMGPRNCIAMRFALLEVKVAIARIVHGFLIEPTAKTPLPMKGQPAGIAMMPPQDLELKLTPIESII